MDYPTWQTSGSESESITRGLVPTTHLMSLEEDYDEEDAEGEEEEERGNEEVEGVFPGAAPNGASLPESDSSVLGSVFVAAKLPFQADNGRKSNARADMEEGTPALVVVGAESVVVMALGGWGEGKVSTPDLELVQRERSATPWLNPDVEEQDTDMYRASAAAEEQDEVEAKDGNESGERKDQGSREMMPLLGHAMRQKGNEERQGQNDVVKMDAKDVQAAEHDNGGLGEEKTQACAKTCQYCERKLSSVSA